MDYALVSASSPHKVTDGLNSGGGGDTRYAHEAFSLVNSALANWNVWMALLELPPIPGAHMSSAFPTGLDLGMKAACPAD